MQLLQAAAAWPAPLQVMARESGRRLALATRGGSDVDPAGDGIDLVQRLQAAAAWPAPLQLLAPESGRRLALATRGGSGVDPAGGAGDLVQRLQAAAARPAPLQLLAPESGQRLALATRGGSGVDLPALPATWCSSCRRRPHGRRRCSCWRPRVASAWRGHARRQRCGSCRRPSALRAFDH
ncbi:hypothetical protein AE923_10590 [Xanthomonas arboricola]|uniref:hypothetical protein n=1 Tax=Xanthomonas arboricola TaxID=56448 RepID=UPI00069CBF14|nr:hypothetical protein [Xanthomonas arboricola]KOB08479.1 hypothetical protein AE923_10590 [Xanthomonas arboricola]